MLNKKFHGTLLVSDIDGTLIGETWEISDVNVNAINYFIKNGGRFTFATGRGLGAIKSLLGDININTPIICYNGSVIYDLDTDEVLWQMPLDDDCIEVIEDVRKNKPNSGISIYNKNVINVYRKGKDVEGYINAEMVMMQDDNFSNISKPWVKALFVQKKSETDELREYIKNKGYEEKFHFAQSCDEYYEMMNKKANKGSALKQLKSMLSGINKTVSVGDNENDIEMIKFADLGIATENAEQYVKDVADLTTIHCEEHAIAHIIENIL